MIAHVICCNNQVRFVVIGSFEHARHMLEQLQDIDYAMNNSKYYNKDVYKASYKWRITTVGAEAA